MDNLIIWESTLDNRFKCIVERDDEINGILSMLDKHDSDRLIFIRRVPLSFGAIYGPDVDDIHDWQEICADYVDKMDKMNGRS